MTTEKITSRDNYMRILDILDNVPDSNDLVDFCNHQIELLDKRAAKARETAAAKREAADPIMDAVLAVLTTEPQTIEDVVAAMDNSDYTIAKVRYRLTQLEKDERVVKSDVTIPGGEGQKSRKVKAYALAE